MIDHRRLAEGARGTRACFHSSRFCSCEPTLHSVLLVSTYDLMIIKMQYADFRDQKFTE
jgi:hypothetical protein